MSNKSQIGLKEAISIGTGGMVGGGIFAALGLAVSLAAGGTPIAFLIAGALALLTSYSYSKLSQHFPDRGGTVKFINQGFGRSVFSGTMNNLLWVSYLIMLSLYASACDLLRLLCDGVGLQAERTQSAKRSTQKLMHQTYGNDQQIF